MRIALREELQEQANTPVHAARENVPLRAGDVLLERRDLEVLFHVDGEMMGDRNW
jgi:hypothetical protein